MNKHSVIYISHNEQNGSFCAIFLAHIGVKNSRFCSPIKPQDRKELLWRLSHTQMPNRNRLQKKSP